MELNIISIAAGKSQTYDKGNEQYQSAYKKDELFNYIEIDELGIIGDEQVDKRYHGGVDKAIHIGSIEHFSRFKEIYKKDMDKLAIGSNILIDKYDENDINLGDIYTIGDVKVEVCQPRQPCWKIGALFGKDTSRYIIGQHATGWYVRVLKGGVIDINDKMILKKRVSNITVKDLSIYIKEPPKDQEIIDELLNSPALAVNYKNSFQKLL